MCAYKLCRVEFRYWGMQTKLEKFIHDVALRKTMVRAHRQAWAWQDEWIGLTMDDIREIEKQTQTMLKRKMAAVEAGELIDDLNDNYDDSCNTNSSITPQDKDVAKTLAATLGSIEKNEDPQSPLSIRKTSDIPIVNTIIDSEGDATPDDSPTTLLPSK